jgi:TonB family protein
MMDVLTLANVIAYSAQVACIAALATCLWTLLRINDADLRYAYWRVVLSLCLLLPLFQPRRVPAALLGTSSAVIETQIGAPLAYAAPINAPLIPWTTALLLLLALGAGARLAWVAVSLVRLQRLRRLGRPAPESEILAELQEIIGASCEVRYVEQLRQPVTFGLRKPVILLPASLGRRSTDVQKAVLCHELFHVKRRDWGWLLAEEIVCALLWFNPAVWWLVSRVHLAREIVVDELAVLATGRRRAYVEALLAFADETSLAPVAAFGGRRQLFDRLVLLSKEGVMSSYRLVFTCAVMTVMLAAGSWQAIDAFPLTAAPPQVVSPNAPGPLEQRANPITPENPIPRRVNYEPPIYPDVAQAAGARATVTLMITLDELGRVAESRQVRQAVTSTNPAASLAFSGVRPGDKFVINGSTVQSDTLRAIAAAMTDAAIRSVQQWRYDPPAAGPISFPVIININGGAATAGPQGMPTPADSAEGAVRVGGNIKPPAKIKDVRPVYPADAQAAGVGGLVIIEARIGRDGAVENARVLRSIPMLDQAALEAVSQWQFTPTLLNGEPVPVLMTVTVNFTLQKSPADRLEATHEGTTPSPAVRGARRGITPSSAPTTERQLPKVIKEVKPKYPPEAFDANLQGTVETEVTIGIDGKVVDARVTRSIPAFDEAALAAVRQWEFTPVPQPVTVQIEMSFSTRRRGGGQ